jgi:hypothetical protein
VKILHRADGNISIQNLPKREFVALHKALWYGTAAHKDAAASWAGDLAGANAIMSWANQMEQLDRDMEREADSARAALEREFIEMNAERQQDESDPFAGLEQAK